MIQQKYLNKKIRRPAPPQFAHLCKSHAIPNTTPPIHVIEGTVVSVTPAVYRTPELFTVQYDGNGGFTERLTADEVEAGLQLMEKRMTSCLVGSSIEEERDRIVHYEEVMKERYDLGMEIKVSHEIIWKLTLVAAMELEYEHRIEERLGQLRNTSAKKSGNSVFCRYYREHPTSYLGGQYVPPTKVASAKSDESEGSGKVIFTPSVLAQRVRTGIAKACDFYQSMVGGQFEPSRRSTRIASSSGPVVKPNILEVGGAVALTLLQMLEEVDDAIIGQGGERLREEGNGKDGDDNNEKEQGNDDEEFNPYFKPTAYMIFDHLRGSRSTTASDIQVAICYAMEDSIPMTLPLFKLTEISDELVPHPWCKVAFECVSGETLKKLQSFDTALFSKCKFKLIMEHDPNAIEEHETMKEEVEEVDQVTTLEAAKIEEKAWRARKQFETWRHTSVNSGKTTWPSWSSFVTELVKSVYSDKVKEDATDKIKEEIVLPMKDDDQSAKDLAIAQAIAEPSVSRRSRRATRSDGGEGPVFYGTNQSLTHQQIIETVQRLVVQAFPRGMTLMELKTLIMGDSESSNFNSMTELKRVRTALGKLVCRYGKIDRMFVNTESDSVCWKVLQTKHLVTMKFLPLPTTKKVAEKDKGQAVMDVKTESSTGTKNDNDSENKVDEVTTNGSRTNEQQELDILSNYIKSLHKTELALRSLVLKHYAPSRANQTFQQISPAVLSLSGDERETDAEGYDKAFFFDEINGELIAKENIEWVTTPPHPLLGKIIYRPSISCSDSMLYVDSSTLSCRWYKVISYCPSEAAIPNEENTETDGNVAELNIKSSCVVNRRVRFRAEPVASPDKTDAAVTSSSDGWILLTEAQVHAGIKAAHIQQTYFSSDTNEKKSHPYRGMVGVRVLLHNVEAVEPESVPSSAIIVGHDTIATDSIDYYEWRVLISLEETASRHCQSIFWAKLHQDETTITNLESGVSYRLEPQEYYPSSPAYMACETVLNYLKSNVKIVPFLEPVDPIALGIPDYPDVIKRPMDVSTVTKKLSEGAYGRIPPGGKYNSPISKMLHGPFYEDIMLIFDNAILFNPKGDFIHNDAVVLKGLVSRKIETLTNRAESQADTSTSVDTGRDRNKSRSIYVAEDSDVDMYEYESDYDDEYIMSTKRGRKRSRSSKPSRVEDYATRGIEQPIEIPNDVNSALYSSLPIVTDSKNFALPQEWICKKTKEKKDNKVKQEDNSENKEFEQLAMLHSQLTDQHTASIRRSTRSHGSSSQVKTSHELSDTFSGFEFILKDGSPMEQIEVGVTLPDTNDRVGVEKMREILHEEYYAKLYYKYCTANNSTIPVLLETETDDGFGSYSDGSFPPFLGRVVPDTSNLSVHVTWEIRSQFVIPALRWVFRGLVASGHLSEWEKFSLSSCDDESLVMANHAYFYNEKMVPYEVLETKRKKTATLEEEEEDEEVEMSAYEKMRAERVARNREKLKALGLA